MRKLLLILMPFSLLAGCASANEDLDIASSRSVLNYLNKILRDDVLVNGHFDGRLPNKFGFYKLSEFSDLEREKWMAPGLTGVGSVSHGAGYRRRDRREVGLSLHFYGTCGDCAFEFMEPELGRGWRKVDIDPRYIPPPEARGRSHSMGNEKVEYFVLSDNMMYRVVVGFNYDGKISTISVRGDKK